MNRIRTLFVIGFMLSLCAGVVVGMVVSQKPSIVTTQPTTTKPSRFTDPLGLSADQKTKLDAIWAEVRKSDLQREEGKRAAYKSRTDAIYALVPIDKKADYDALQTNHTTALADLDKERDRVRLEAEKKMKDLLTADQWKKFQEMKQHRRPRGGSTNPSGPGGNGSGGNDPGGPGFSGGPRSGKHGPDSPDHNRPGPANAPDAEQK